MNATEIRQKLDDVSSDALIFHGFLDYVHDYELIIQTGGGRSSVPLTYLRYLFKHCVEADIQTTEDGATWKTSLDDGLISYDDVSGHHLST